MDRFRRPQANSQPGLFLSLSFIARRKLLFELLIKLFWFLDFVSCWSSCSFRLISLRKSSSSFSFVKQSRLCISPVAPCSPESANCLNSIGYQIRHNILDKRLTGFIITSQRVWSFSFEVSVFDGTIIESLFIESVFSITFISNHFFYNQLNILLFKIKQISRWFYYESFSFEHHQN